MDNEQLQHFHSRLTWPESFHNRSKRIVTIACRKIYMYIYISVISGNYRSLFLTKKTGFWQMQGLLN